MSFVFYFQLTPVYLELFMKYIFAYRKCRFFALPKTIEKNSAVIIVVVLLFVRGICQIMSSTNYIMQVFPVNLYHEVQFRYGFSKNIKFPLDPCVTTCGIFVFFR